MMKPPDPDKILRFRVAMEFTQKEAAALVHVTLRTWQWWESGGRAMPLATWELCLIKGGYHPLYGAKTKVR
jgi:DNA-binding transcriptional regulator YiaG